VGGLAVIPPLTLVAQKKLFLRAHYSATTRLGLLAEIALTRTARASEKHFLGLTPVDGFDRENCPLIV